MFAKFFKKTKDNDQPQLLDIVKRITNTGYVFWNINDDLGKFAQEIMGSTPLIKMSYAYARRSAAAAMYVQGLFDKASYEHVVGIFKSLQQQTGHTVEFQEAAAADASKYLNSYNHLITSFFEKKVIQIANEYDVPSHRISDADLFASVIETAYTEMSELASVERPIRNYNIKPNGFTIEDAESGDGFAAVIRDGMFHGAVLIRAIGAQGPLNPWPIGENPFKDDYHYFGAGTSPQGDWSFSIRPTSPFSQILKEARERYIKSRGIDNAFNA